MEIIPEANVQSGLVDIPDQSPFGPAKIHFTLYSQNCDEDESRLIRLVMLCGFGATQLGYLPMIAQLVRRSSRYQILTLDHRTVGQSVCVTKSRLTSTRLAQDALAVLDHIGWKNNVSVYGPSMGGMVAQEMLLLDLPRFESVFFSVTSAGSPVRLPFGPGLMSFMLPKFLPDSDEGKAKMLVGKAFSKKFLDLDPKTQPPNRFVPAEALKFNSYREWFQHWFSPPQDGAKTLTWEPHSLACVSCVPTSHYVSAERLRMIIKAGIRIFVHICRKDESMPPSDQLTMLERLGGKSDAVEVLIFDDCGHMGATERPNQFWTAFVEFLEKPRQVI